jgi:hypothetical protein
MRIGLGIVLAASVLAGAAVWAGWLQQSQRGLGQLLTGTIATSPSGGGSGPMLADWRDPHGKAGAPPVAMSESGWLMLTDDLAPVSYLSEAARPEAAGAGGEQQPL